VDSSIIETLSHHFPIDCSSSSEVIQSLWSGYGKLTRLQLSSLNNESIIVKHVVPPTDNNHPRGWHSDLSHRRKLRSYEIELNFYKHFASQCNEHSRVPAHLWSDHTEDQFILVLEDLMTSGYPEVLHSVNVLQFEACIQWLANFHAVFMGIKPDGLWDIGSYWHMDTRPDELKALKDQDLKAAASNIDKRLNNAVYQTIIHGDAKLANFCFSSEGSSVAAVDFQYVGGGCGMKDLAYFVGSCLSEKDAEDQELKILDLYFSALNLALTEKSASWPLDDIRSEWQPLYRVAWADFHRFLKGWSPQHWKINSYSERICREVSQELGNL